MKSIYDIKVLRLVKIDNYADMIIDKTTPYYIKTFAVKKVLHHANKTCNPEIIAKVTMFIELHR